jgi:hypothetical protein
MTVDKVVRGLCVRQLTALSEEIPLPPLKNTGPAFVAKWVVEIYKRAPSLQKLLRRTP